MCFGCCAQREAQDLHVLGDQEEVAQAGPPVAALGGIYT